MKRLVGSWDKRLRERDGRGLEGGEQRDAVELHCNCIASRRREVHHRYMRGTLRVVHENREEEREETIEDTLRHIRHREGYVSAADPFPKE